MKALVLENYNQLIYKDVPDPVIKPDEVLVQVKACGICGSDIRGLDGSTGRRIPPLIMGHEASGVIADTGSGVTGWNKGDRVTFDSTVYRLDDWFTIHGLYNLSDNREVMGVSPGTYRRNGAFAEYIAIPRHILYKIPDNVSFEEAAMVEPAAVALHSINISGLQAGNSTLVVGAGMIGIFIVRLLKISGASVIFAIDTKMERNRKALESGADFAFHPDDRSIIERIKSQTGNRGTDISFEVIGKSISIQFAVENTRRGGTIVLVGNTSPVVDFPLQKVVTGEMKVLGSCAICGEYEIVLDLLSKRRFTVNDQIGAVAPLSQGAQWFEKLYKNELNPGKVILVP